MADLIRVLTTRPSRIEGREVAPGTEVDVAVADAVNVVSSGRGRLVNPDDARRLQRHAWAQCPSRGLPAGGF